MKTCCQFLTDVLLRYSAKHPIAGIYSITHKRSRRRSAPLMHGRSIKLLLIDERFDREKTAQLNSRVGFGSRTLALNATSH
jgi:hypothetical protein